MELMLVIAIMTLVAGVVWPSFSRSMPLLAVRGAARTVFAFAQRARSEAVARAVRFRLTLDLSERSLQVAGEIEPLDQPGEFLEINAPWGRRIELDSRVRIEQVTIDEGDQVETLTAGECELIFRPDGTATDAEIVLVADDDSRQVIVIRGVTGRIEVSGT